MRVFVSIKAIVSTALMLSLVTFLDTTVAASTALMHIHYSDPSAAQVPYLLGVMNDRALIDIYSQPYLDPW